MRTSPNPILFGVIGLAALALLTGACGDDRDRPAPLPAAADSIVHGDTFSPPNPGADRTLDTVMELNLFPEGTPQYFVASLTPDTLRPPASRADVIQIYRRDSLAHRFTLAFTDTARWIHTFESRDLTGDGFPEVIAFTDAGGTSIVASRGIVIYSGHGGRPGVLFRLERGTPVFIEMGPSRVEAIASYDELWPSFTARVHAVQYLSDIYAVRDGRFVSIRTEQPAPFIKNADEFLEEYRELRVRFRADTLRPPDSLATPLPPDTAVAEGARLALPHPLFVCVAKIALSFSRGGQTRSLRSFWTSEQEYVRKRIPAEQFTELQSIVSGLLPQ